MAMVLIINVTSVQLHSRKHRTARYATAAPRVVLVCWPSAGRNALARVEGGPGRRDL
jgi:hypothetical protein